MNKITSVQNQLIKDTAALRDARARKETGLTIIDGVREIRRAFEAEIKLKHVFVCPKLFSNRGEEELLAQLMADKVEAIEVSDVVFGKMAFGERGEGLIATAVVPKIKLEDIRLSKKPLLVIVEGVEKPGNLGAIMRSCDGAGVEALIICDGKTDAYNPNVIRASTGVVFSLPVVSARNEDTLAYLKKNKIKTAAAIVGAKQNYADTNLSAGLAIVLGSEDEGLSPFWATHADLKLTIPMLGVADSLNVSTSAAIILYEAIRQRKV